jgi:hypothetical protein
MKPFRSFRNRLDEQRALALKFHCRLAAETAHPRFAWVDPRGFTVILSVNSGYE